MQFVGRSQWVEMDPVDLAPVENAGGINAGRGSLLRLADLSHD